MHCRGVAFGEGDWCGVLVGKARVTPNERTRAKKEDGQVVDLIRLLEGEDKVGLISACQPCSVACPEQSDDTSTRSPLATVLATQC